jgi:hypothetical protein
MVSTKLAMGAILGVAMLAAMPAKAALTFAAFQPIGNGANFYWKNSGAPGFPRSGGSSASVYTIASDSSTVPGSALISFSYLVPGLTSVSNVTALFTLVASTNVPAVDDGTDIYNDTISGNFTIKTTAPITIGSVTYGAGSNLLSAYFTNAEVDGATRGTAGSFDNGTEFDPSMYFTSDFLNFSAVDESDFALSLVSITNSLSTRSASTALRTFKAQAVGNFASDPLPVPTMTVPETASWAMFIVGFGLMGATLRRRRPEYSLV